MSRYKLSFITDENLLKSLYLLTFREYEGFEDLNID